MTRTTARKIIRAATDSGGDTDRYSNLDIDVALLLVGNDFVGRTACTHQLSQVAIVAATATVDFVALTGFRDEFAEEISLVESPSYAAGVVQDALRVVAWSDLRLERGQRGIALGTPELIAFKTTTLAHLWRTPAYAGTLDVWWHPPFTSFDPGTADDGAALNIPDDLITPVLVHGAAVIVQMTDPEAIERALRTGAYDAHVMRSSGRGGRAPRSFRRTTLADMEE